MKKVLIAILLTLLVLVACAFIGIEPLAGIKDRLIGRLSETLSPYDVEILPGQSAMVQDWFITLDGGGWEGGTVTVDLTITNHGARRSLGGYSILDVGGEIVAIDSTGKLVEPWVPEPNLNKGEWFARPPYTRELYPNESWSCTLKFELSPYSGKTNLYLTHSYHIRRYCLFALGEPRRQ